MNGKLQGTGENRQSQVTEQMRDIEKYLSDLSENISSLSGRLDSVLREDQPKDAKEKAVDQAIVPHAHHLREMAGSIKNSSRRISDIIDRLEI